MKEPSKEYAATVKDFKILLTWPGIMLIVNAKDTTWPSSIAPAMASLLPSALNESEKSVDQWNKLLDIATPFYHHDMQTGQIENGHWKDKKFLVETNPKIVREAADTLHAHGIFDWGIDFDRTSLSREVKTFAAFKYYNDFFYERRFTGVGPNQLYNPRVGFGF